MVARTRSEIACFAGPSFHDGNSPPGAAVCAGAEAGRNGADKAGRHEADRFFLRYQPPRPALDVGDSFSSRTSSSFRLMYLPAGPHGTQLDRQVTGGQDFVRVYAERVYGIPPEEVVGTAGATKYGYGKDGKPFLTKEPKLLLNDNNAGKVEGIHMMIGRRPYAAFGNSTGDRQMLEWAGAGAGARLKMLVLHDDAAREYAYGPAQGLPDTKVGTFTLALYDEAKKNGWTVISMKNDWRRIFAF